ncbi:signal peptide peptidase-like 2 [Papaver somniferum]|uniref:signal peptide peptidase-like 2 n=1 Tax=Papaver somniferum TaxID=3469 RepID=UPI000E6F49A7|nr:signal peptide peptidase-like 2 [Papaver somniferum]
MHACLVTVILRIFKNSGTEKVNLPCLGEITVLSMGVFPFCLAFAIFWAANQHVSYAWVAKMFLSHPYLYWVILDGWAWSTCTPVSCSLYFGAYKLY